MSVERLMFSEKLNHQILAQEKKFIITGASGWLGMALLEVLYACFKENLSQRVIALSHSQPMIRLRDGYQIKTQGYHVNIADDSEYILCHFAFLIKDKTDMMSSEEYRNKNAVIRNYVVNIIQKAKPNVILYSSSGAVYHQDDLYGLLKQEDEVYFSKLAKDINARIIIPRIFNLAGPYINKCHSYALSSFILQLVNHKKVVLHAKNPVIRSYIHILDLFQICFCWIFDHNQTEKSITFDTGSYPEIELYDLSKMIIDLIEPQSEILINRDQTSSAQRYVGNIQSQLALCDKYDISLIGYKKMILDTADFLINDSVLIPAATTNSS